MANVPSFQVVDVVLLGQDALQVILHAGRINNENVLHLELCEDFVCFRQRGIWNHAHHISVCVRQQSLQFDSLRVLVHVAAAGNEVVEATIVDVANEVLSHHKWEAGEWRPAQQSVEVFDSRVVGEVDRLQLCLHHVAAALCESNIRCFRQEWVALQHYVEVIDALIECITDDFSNQDSQHERNDFVQVASQLKHYDDERDGDTAHTSKNSSCSHHRINAWLDGARNDAERLVQSIKSHTHEATQARTCKQRWHKEPSWASRAKCKNCLREANDGSTKQGGQQWQVCLCVRTTCCAKAKSLTPPKCNSGVRGIFAVLKHGMNDVDIQGPCEEQRPRSGSCNASN
mmetsp:Transcript_9824/g.21968  ORF Transcript_9824/g.21968 Transcript_9824/m.21968 type:complete len:344 (-) Transcript_9824:1242-2273(-)